MLRVAVDDQSSAEMPLALDEICREGARRMLAAAMEAERDAYLASFAEERDDDGHRLVVGNGRARARVVATGAGPVEVEAPRVNDRRVDDESGERCRFRSQTLAPWCPKSPKISEVLPLMYLHGMSSGDFVPALTATGSRQAAGRTCSDARRRGMTAPMVMVGDGALGMWSALGEVFPETVTQRCWVHYAEQRIMPSWGRVPLPGKGSGLLKSA